MKKLIILLERAPQVTLSPKHEHCKIRAHQGNLNNESIKVILIGYKRIRVLISTTCLFTIFEKRSVTEIQIVDFVVFFNHKCIILSRSFVFFTKFKHRKSEILAKFRQTKRRSFRERIGFNYLGIQVFIFQRFLRSKKKCTIVEKN